MNDREDASEVDAGERFQRARRRGLFALTLLFALQSLFRSGVGDNPGLLLWSNVKLPAFMVWAAALLFMMTVPGGVFLKAPRPALNDELTRKHRAGGFAAGLLAALATAVAMYFLTMFRTVTTREALHAVITLGVVATVFTFVFLEERAERAS